MQRPSSIILTALVFAGCVAAPSSHGGAGGEIADRGGEPLGGAQEADELLHGPGYDRPGLDPQCENARNQEAHNSDWPSHEHHRSCADRQGFDIEDAARLCGGDVKFFSYDCSDFPANAPYQPDDQRAWTAYFACCPSSPSDHHPPPVYGPPPYGPPPVYGSPPGYEYGSPPGYGYGSHGYDYGSSPGYGYGSHGHGYGSHGYGYGSSGDEYGAPSGYGYGAPPVFDSSPGFDAAPVSGPPSGYGPPPVAGPPPVEGPPSPHNRR